VDRGWKLGKERKTAMVIQRLGSLNLMLDGEGVFEALHAGLQILDFALRLLDEEGFNSA
jgi:hypothetical protein